jgi:glutaredoxin
MKPHVTLYTRAGCHLCEDAKATVMAARRRVEFEYEEVDIDRDAALRQLYNEEVPVVALNGIVVFRYAVDLEALIKRLSAIMI